MVGRVRRDALWHDFDADPAQPTRQRTGPGSFGNDYIAGNQGNDMVLGELGDDTIQGDGSIDYVAHRLISDTTAANGTVDPSYNVAQLGRVAAYRHAGRRDRPGRPAHALPVLRARRPTARTTSRATAATTSIFGGLGQDDIVGGSSSFFSLTTADQRPDGGDDI